MAAIERRMKAAITASNAGQPAGFAQDCQVVPGQGSFISS
jgi:hypothetical protein